MSIRHDVISRLVRYRALTSMEMTELDNLAIAVGLHDNDPMWGVIGWGWATLPRRTDFDLAVQAISDQNKKEALDMSAMVRIEADLKALRGNLDQALSRPVHNASPEINEWVLRKALAAVMPAFVPKAGATPQIDFIKQFKDAVREGVSWVWVGLAGAGFALALVLGYVGGETMQWHDDGPQIHALRGQVNTLTAVVVEQGKKEHRKR